jgi:UDP-3-O-[3-hydroxymyristoyl] glucosamine N-acyltransferase
VKLGDIARQIGLDPGELPDIDITGVSTIENASSGQIAFLANSKYEKHLATTGASAVLVPQNTTAVPDKTLVRCGNPYYSFLRVVELFHPPIPLSPGIHPTAILGEETLVGPDATIGPYVVTGKRCRIGANSALLPFTVLGDDVVIGESTTLHAHVCVREKVQIGSRVIIHSGTVIGSDGFGFAPEGGKYHKIPQVGIVVIEDDVEIGANVTVDRATLGETRIKLGAKLDNLIQIAHNCTVGEHTVIAAQSGLSGSTHIGKGVRIGGQVGFAGHLSVGDGAAVGAQSGVPKSIAAGETMFGTPARPIKDELRIQAAVHRLPDLVKEMHSLKERIERLEKIEPKP